MAGWFKDFDPLKGAKIFDIGSPVTPGGGWKTGTAIGQAIQRTMANSRERRRAEAEREAEQQRQDELLKNPPPLHGSAQWATVGELGRAGRLRPMSQFDSPSSLLLGAMPDAPDSDRMAGHLHWDGEGHLLTVAPTRSGKSTTTIIPNLLRYRGSCVVLDPKGELYEQTAGWRAANVGPVYRIAPFAAATDAFNPLMTMQRASDARELAELIIPDDPHASEFFKRDGVAFLAGLIWFTATTAPAPYCNLAEVRNITASPLPAFRAVLEEMAQSRDPAIRNPAQIALSKDQDKAVRTLRDTLAGHLSFLDEAGIARASAVSDVDFRTLKDRPATVYVSIPFNKMSAYADFLKILLTTALEAMIENERVPDIPVLFILDEFLSLKSFPKFRDAIRTHAGAGVRLWFFLQDLPTLEEYYPTSWKAFFHASVKQFFGTNDGFTGRQISEWLGDTTVAYQTSSLSSNSSTSTGPVFGRDGNRGSSVNQSIAFTGRPLLTPDEAVHLLSGTLPDQTRHGLTFISGVNPIRNRLVPWFLGKELPRRAGSKSPTPAKG